MNMQKLKPLSVPLLRILAVVVISSGMCASAAVAGIFGPSNYAECITESMQGVTSDTAAKIIMSACLEQFPREKKRSSKTEKSPSKTEKPKDRRSFNNRLKVMAEESNGASRAVAKISYVQYEKLDILQRYDNVSVIRFMNRNPFPIGNVVLGIDPTSPGDRCSWDSKDYKYTVFCGGHISANSSGKVTCDELSSQFCIIGFATDEYFTYEFQVQEFIEKYSLD